ncbi:VOC family protein [Bordetella sp. FB-8]|uniref:VOC family protein n=1 Tax=Bordetella sp. FB-8 TaxID=1159870 RepID=UPI00039A1DB9|nr:VOC family protein [Bordetella sp. FB-8]
MRWLPRDLDAAQALYQGMGFQVGARNRHRWGTEIRLLQFGSSFIELIAVGSDARAIADHVPGRVILAASCAIICASAKGWQC